MVYQRSIVLYLLGLSLSLQSSHIDAASLLRAGGTQIRGNPNRRQATKKNDCQWKSVDIPRIDANDIGTVEDFYDKYSESPVIITGIVDETWGLTDEEPEWDFDFLLDKCPQAELPIMEKVHDSEQWANLVMEGVMPLEDFVQYVEEESQEQENKLYGFDLVIRQECPELLPFFKVPRFCNECVLQSDHVRGHFQEEFDEEAIFAWPTMMIGPQGSTSALHVDNEGLPFWMALLKGRKHWRVLPYKANYNLTGPDPHEQFHPPPFGKDFRGAVLEEYYGGGTYEFDGFDPDFKEYPSLCHAEMHEGILEAGEVIYVPNSAPHGVINLEHTIAITANYFHPLDKSQQQWLRKNCNEADEDRGYSHEVCRYMFDRIRHREENLGPQEDLDLESYMNEHYFQQNFDEEL